MLHVEHPRYINNAEPAHVSFTIITPIIITADMRHYASKLAEGGDMLLSGFYEEDVETIFAEASNHGLKHTGTYVLDRWTCLQLKKLS